MKTKKQRNTLLLGSWMPTAIGLCLASACGAGGSAADDAAAAVDTEAAGEGVADSATEDGAGPGSDAQSTAATDAAGDDTSDVAADASTAEASTADASAGDGAVSGSCYAAKAAGHSQVTCGDLVFEVHVPAQCLNKACGLIGDVHGWTMSGQMEDHNTNTRALGEKYDFIVVQPSANPAPPTASWTPNVDDEKIFAFLKDTAATYAVDPKRIHFMGFSQGGWMSWRMLCKHSDWFASVAPGSGCSFSGTEGCNFLGTQMPAFERPVLYMHGTKDALQAISCGLQQVAAVQLAWTLGPATTVTADAGHVWLRQVSAKGTVFEFIQHEYAAKSFVLGGHCYPGSQDLDGGEPGQLFGFGCKAPNAFAWGEAAVKFFLAHPLP